MVFGLNPTLFVGKALLRLQRLSHSTSISLRPFFRHSPVETNPVLQASMLLNDGRIAVLSGTGGNKKELPDGLDESFPTRPSVITDRMRLPGIGQHFASAFQSWAGLRT